jgi:hypothetical protein
MEEKNLVLRRHTLDYIKQAVEKKFQGLNTGLELIPSCKNRIEEFVCLFALFSGIQDQGSFMNEIHFMQKQDMTYRPNLMLLEKLYPLQAHIDSFGRDHSFNRSNPGEAVTAENIILGGIFSLPEKAAQYWLDNQVRLEQELRPEIKLTSFSNRRKKAISNWQIIHDYQVGMYIDDHLPIIRKKIISIQEIIDNSGKI